MAWARVQQRRGGDGHASAAQSSSPGVPPQPSTVVLQSQQEVRAAKAKAFQAEAEGYRRMLRERSRRAFSPDGLIARVWDDQEGFERRDFTMAGQRRRYPSHSPDLPHPCACACVYACACASR